MWGSSFRQRLRLAPLYAAITLADALGRFMPRRTRTFVDWAPGITVIIPERDAPQMLEEALAALGVALEAIDEPAQIIVVVNGAPRGSYDALAQRFPAVEFIHSGDALGFAGAIAHGLAHARHEGTLLLNNDMTLAPRALAELLPLRAPDVFAIAAQIFPHHTGGRREETGFTDWFVDGGGVHLFHAEVRDDRVRDHLCASGGAALFRTHALRRYLPGSRCYDPFYWEDVDWGVRAWRDGMRVLFAPRSQATHRHRATTARFYPAADIERIVERNRWLFDLRHGITTNGAAWLMERICDLPYASQREIAGLSQAGAVFRRRLARRSELPLPPPLLVDPHRECVALRSVSYSYELRESLPSSATRRRLLLVTPFAIFPARHGGARRIAELIEGLRPHFDIVLITDEASLYDARSFAYFDDLFAVSLVQRGSGALDDQPNLTRRMRRHAHAALIACVAAALARHHPAIVQIEYAELAGLVALRDDDARWVLGLHDAYARADFDDDGAARTYRTTLDAYDAVTVCSDEDRRMVTHRRVTTIPNGIRAQLQPYAPSASWQVLFVGPFRYAPNREGIAHFLRTAWPAIRHAVPAAALLILGGDEHREFADGNALFMQPGVTVVGHRDDVGALLASSALAINPLVGIRGSAVKLIESLAAGRVCVSTHEGARGFDRAAWPALVIVADVPAMAAPITELLLDAAQRHRLEAPAAALEPFSWARSADKQLALYQALVASPTVHDDG